VVPLDDDRDVAPAPTPSPDDVPPEVRSGSPRVFDPAIGDVCLLPATSDRPMALAVPRRDVLVVAGLPGAGKTTLLREVAGAGDLVLDPQELGDHLRRKLPSWVPYRWYRPVVHVWHRGGVVVRLVRGDDGLIIHEPGGRPRWRRHLVRLARSRGSAVHLLVVRADPAEAEEGRHRRQRTLPRGRAARHELEWAEMLEEISHDWRSSRLAAEGFAGCTLLPRSAVPFMTALRRPVDVAPPA
jgi:hypothetical protein